MYTCRFMCVYMHVCVHTHSLNGSPVSSNSFTLFYCVCVCVCVCIPIHKYVCACIYMYIYTCVL